MTFPLKSRFFSHSNWYIRSIMRQNIDFIICCSLFNSDICGNISVKIFQFYYFALFFPSIDFFLPPHTIVDWFLMAIFLHFVFFLVLCSLYIYDDLVLLLFIHCIYDSRMQMIIFFGSDMWKWMWKRKEKFIFFFILTKFLGLKSNAIRPNEPKQQQRKCCYMDGEKNIEIFCASKISMCQSPSVSVNDDNNKSAIQFDLMIDFFSHFFCVRYIGFFFLIFCHYYYHQFFFYSILLVFFSRICIHYFDWWYDMYVYVENLMKIITQSSSSSSNVYVY